eukprot:CAMPEP_0178458738 /NCGR_PEP_ID=MMETSP0689_2-20121128/47703_1 /TAXON_ID=160604 /ORGANISM="Amphidinium massartii, Strain CS-259" /LENGTH=1363 /DNA_ID=CAMNT_0020085061 /DNA_START=40 /DNA_END=4129 /DNA_ORIENTATION=-
MSARSFSEKVQRRSNAETLLNTVEEEDLTQTASSTGGMKSWSFGSTMNFREHVQRAATLQGGSKIRSVFEDLTDQLSDPALPPSGLQQLLLRLGHCVPTPALNELIAEALLSQEHSPSFSSTSVPAQFSYEASVKVHMQCERRYSTRTPEPVFLFVNPSSGGRLAARWLDLPSTVRAYDLPRPRTTVSSFDRLRAPLCAELRIYSLREGKAGKKAGFLDVKAASKEAPPDSKIRIKWLVGDGTVNWVVSELDRHGIDTDLVTIGVAGYGTGNDFSRVLGWGGDPPLSMPDDVNRLHRLVGGWLVADQVTLDLWQVTVRTHPGGSFSVVQSDGNLGLTSADVHRMNVRSDKNGCQFFTRFFVNYFSMGIAAQIGAAFEQQRGKSRTANMLVYAREGFMKAASAQTTIKIDNVVEELYNEDKIVFSTNEDAEADYRPTSHIMSLIFLNIPSMAGGSDIWRRASALTVPGASRFRSFRQDFGDGNLEVMTFSSAADFIKEKLGPALHGNGKRCHSGRGPFRVKFKPVDDEVYSSELEKTGGLLYMQADGEYFAVVVPAQAEVAWSRSISVLQHAEGGLDAAESELYGDASRLLHFMEYAKRRGHHDAVKLIFAAAALRGSGLDASARKEWQEAEAALHEKFIAPVLTAYQADPEGRRATLQCLPDLLTSKRQVSALSEELQEKLESWHEQMGESIDEEDKYFAFAISVIRGLSMALLLEERTLHALLSKDMPGVELDEEEVHNCLQHWCGPHVDIDTLQASYVRKFEVPRAGHFLSAPCEIPFIFEDVAPDIFRRLRSLAGVDDTTYRSSLCREDFNLITLDNRASSGELFFYSHDKQFIVKTLTRGQAHTLVGMLPTYERHLSKHRNSLLVRYLGLHRLVLCRDPGNGGETYGAAAARFLVVMGNVTHCPWGITEQYDLKGMCNPKRASAMPMGACGDPDKPMHELDWCQRHDKRGPLHLSPEASAHLMAQHVADTAMLESFGISNYSLLVGVYTVNKAQLSVQAENDETVEHGNSSPGSSPRTPTPGVAANLPIRSRSKASCHSGHSPPGSPLCIEIERSKSKSETVKAERRRTSRSMLDTLSAIGRSAGKAVSIISGSSPSSRVNSVNGREGRLCSKQVSRRSSRTSSVASSPSPLPVEQRHQIPNTTSASSAPTELNGSHQVPLIKTEALASQENNAEAPSLPPSPSSSKVTTAISGNMAHVRDLSPCSQASSSATRTRSKANSLKHAPQMHMQKLERRFRPGEAIYSENGSELYFIGIISILNAHVRKKDLQPARGLVRITAREQALLSDPSQYRVRQAAFFRQVVGVADAGHVHEYAEDSTPSPTDSLPSTGSWGQQRVGGRLVQVGKARSVEVVAHVEA